MKDPVCDCDMLHPELVAACRETMPEDALFVKLAEFYKIMGDPTRCRIICALQYREMCVCDLANVLNMTKSSISHQLSKMRSLGVVKCRRAGKSVFYSLDDDHVSQIFTVTLSHIRHKL